jgi:hypothetical protein
MSKDSDEPRKRKRHDSSESSSLGLRSEGEIVEPVKVK